MEDYDDIHEELLLNSPEWAKAWFENKQYENATTSDISRLEKMLQDGSNGLIGI